jgi:hypothetical protein
MRYWSIEAKTQSEKQKEVTPSEINRSQIKIDEDSDVEPEISDI